MIVTNLKNLQNQNIYHVSLIKDSPNLSEEYLFKYDLNGKYIISTSENKNKDTESEYVLVEFFLDSKKLNNKEIYIYGELTNWNILEKAKLNYNNKQECYYGFLFLKQGYYNYQYIITDENNTTYTLDENYHETRNEYSIYVYHTPIWSNYERLISITKSSSNSLN